LIQPFVGR